MSPLTVATVATVKARQNASLLPCFFRIYTHLWCCVFERGNDNVVSDRDVLVKQVKCVLQVPNETANFAEEEDEIGH